MPYSNVPKPLWGKMDSCVKKVMATGKPKKNAIAICHARIVGSAVHKEASKRARKGK